MDKSNDFSSNSTSFVKIQSNPSKNNANNFIGTSSSYAKCVTTDNLYLTNNRLNTECVGNASIFASLNDFDFNHINNDSNNNKQTKEVSFENLIFSFRIFRMYHC